MRKTVEEILKELQGPYKIQISPHVDLNKEFRKDKPLYEKIERIFIKISQNPFHAGKPLRNCLKNNWRVPVNNHSYVLIYCIDKEAKVVTIEKYASHHEAYNFNHTRAPNY